jgi:hypothetical protein
MRAGAVAVLLAACKLGFTEEDPPDAAVVPDAPLGPWSAPGKVMELADPTLQDDDPSLTADQLEVYFDSERPGGAIAANGDCWVATRARTSDPFGAPTLVAELASLADDTTFDVAPDGLTIYFASDRKTAGDRDIYVATRPDRSSPWSTPQRVAELSSPADENGASELADGLHIVFASARAGTGDLYIATRTARDQPWQAPAAIPGLSITTYDESQFWVNADATVVYFSSGDAPGAQGSDVWLATRATPDEPFGPPLRIAELDGALDDADPWLTADQRTIYFSSHRTGGGDIYQATR